MHGWRSYRDAVLAERAGVLRPDVDEHFGGGGDEDELLEFLFADAGERVAGVVAADLLVFGNVVEDFFSGQGVRERLPSATLLARVGGDFDGIVPGTVLRGGFIA